MRINQWSKNLRQLGIMISLIVCFFLAGCGDSASTNNIIEAWWYYLEYGNKIKLEKISLSSDDMEEITQLYQEVWEVTSYKDSLLIAEKYARWLWMNAFAQENLDTLETQWLKLDNIKKTQISLIKNRNKLNAVLVEYEIIEWLVPEVPVLYVSELFVPSDTNVLFFSFITESQSVHKAASNMFKSIKEKKSDF